MEENEEIKNKYNKGLNSLYNRYYEIKDMYKKEIEELKYNCEYRIKNHKKDFIIR